MKVRDQPLCASLVLAMLLAWHTKLCWARHKCSCNCMTEVVSPSDPPHDVWSKINPEVVQTLGCAQITFIASGDSHVCLQQIKEFSKINDSNVELLVLDGHKEIFTLKYYPNRWQKRELCSESNSLTFQLKKLNVKLDFNPELLSFHFDVVHIESPRRKLFLEDSFCDETYRLYNSTIDIRSKFTNVQELNRKVCGINLVKDSGNPKNMCLFYSLVQQNESIHWDVYISTVKYSFNPQDHVFSFNASSPKTGAWCSGVSFIMIIFESVQHTGNLFTISAYDFNGTTDEFLEFLYSKRAGPISTTSSSVGGGVKAHITYIPIVVVAAVVLFILVLVLILTISVRSVCNTVTKKTACSSTSGYEQKHKINKADIVVIRNQNHFEQKNLLHSL
ncbi:hypothetical protein BgiBS90_014998 [Biomphalaria glabrata]|nr:hypothetical protein BgiBS90_014998 [Biomphalaria glabrata]